MTKNHERALDLLADEDLRPDVLAVLAVADRCTDRNRIAALISKLETETSVFEQTARALGYYPDGGMKVIRVRA